MQSGGGNDSVDTKQLFDQFLADNQSELLSMQSGGGSVNVNDSVDTNQLFSKFLSDNLSESYSLQSGGGLDDDNLYNSIDSDLMSTGTIDIFTNFINRNKKNVQMGGSKIDKNAKKSVVSIRDAIELLQQHYK